MTGPVLFLAEDLPDHRLAMHLAGRAAGREKLDVRAIVATACSGEVEPFEDGLASTFRAAGGDEVWAATASVPSISRVALPASDTARADDGVAALARWLRATSEPVTVVCLGAPTALAVALVQDPSLSHHLKRVVLVAGAYFVAGDVSPAAERSAHHDPLALRVVLDSDVPVTVVPLDVTDQLLLEPGAPLGSHRDDSLRDMLFASWASQPDPARDRFAGRVPVRAAAAVLWLVEPELFAGRDVHIAVETVSELAYGVTSVDWWQLTDEPHNAWYVADVDVAGASTVLQDLLGDNSAS